MRLDALLVHRGLVESREKARALILAGKVIVPGHASVKAGALISTDAEIRVAEPEHPWVSRGGMKMAHALQVFNIDVAGRLGLDIGASTGGFTDVLLQRGARHVVALDVGRNQLHWKLRSDPRVTVIEGANARALSPRDVPRLGGGADIVTIDVSFISLRLILPVVPALLASGAHVVALVKPQFEAGRADVGRGGLVKDVAVHARVIQEVSDAAAAVGLTPIAVVESPITGAEGNREFLMHLIPTRGAHTTLQGDAHGPHDASLTIPPEARPASEDN
jgi:23S rRNA (cytidine1920-2'-O)/16S rRNA (cytidine1409-2'-O)-methyltransferase